MGQGGATFLDGKTMVELALHHHGRLDEREKIQYPKGSGKA